MRDTTGMFINARVNYQPLKRRGVLAGGDDYPCISDIIDALKRLNTRAGTDRAKAKDKLLDRLEMFIEQPVPIPDMYADPLCRALDEVEASIEHHDHIRNPVTEELYEVLCDLEYKIEHQTQVAPGPDTNSPNVTASSETFTESGYRRMNAMIALTSRKPTM